MTVAGTPDDHDLPVRAERVEVEAFELMRIQSQPLTDARGERGGLLLVQGRVPVAAAGDGTHRVDGLDQRVTRPVERLFDHLLSLVV